MINGQKKKGFLVYTILYNIYQFFKLFEKLISYLNLSPDIDSFKYNFPNLKIQDGVNKLQW